jgi:hypothetical protein
MGWAKFWVICSQTHLIAVQPGIGEATSSSPPTLEQAPSLQLQPCKDRKMQILSDPPEPVQERRRPAHAGRVDVREPARPSVRL